MTPAGISRGERNRDREREILYTYTNRKGERERERVCVCVCVCVCERDREIGRGRGRWLWQGRWEIWYRLLESKTYTQNMQKKMTVDDKTRKWWRGIIEDQGICQRRDVIHACLSFIFLWLWCAGLSYFLPSLLTNSDFKEWNKVQ